MPRSKRARLVALTKTPKRTSRDHKASFIREVRDAVDGHENLYLFSYSNMRSNKFKDIRIHFRVGRLGGDMAVDEDGGSGGGGSSSDKPTRIFLGKNKLLQVALGRSPEDEYSDNLRHVSDQITGSVGLIFTSRPRSDVEDFFASHSEPDFARAGFVSPRDVFVTNEMLFHYPVSMVEQQFRKQGLPVDIDNGKVVLRDGMDKYRLCKEGETLSPEKCKLLVHFGIQLSEFRVKLVCRWSDGEFEPLT